MKLTSHQRNTRGVVAFITTALCLSVWSSEPLVIQELQRDANDVRLSWIGGAPPFLVQHSPGLAEWADLKTTEDRSYTISNSDATGFFRVRGARDVDLGELYGQWRIAQGEFGEPLAKHRLKSLWDFHFPTGESPPVTAKSFFTTASLRIQYLDGGSPQTFVGRLEDLPGATLKTEARKITVAWNWGKGDWERDMSLEMTFRYDVDSLRFAKVNLSDPSITLLANYHSPQSTINERGEASMVKSEEADLVEIDDAGRRPAWWNREIQFTQSGVTIDSRFAIGVPNIEGGPAFIFKTPLLVSWEKTTVTGLVDQPIEFMGRFSQTYEPFHHNFVETLWLEPALESGMAPEILEELKDKNIRFIVPQNPSAFPNQKPSLRVVGFDNTIRQL